MKDAANKIIVTSETCLEKLGIHIKLNKNYVSHVFMAKHTWLSFGTRKKTSEPGELISADACGPFESFQKKRYLVILKDSFIKFCYVYLIKEQGHWDIL
ncbi:hypothetical protein TNIN_30961 [Trichonephila inaurata madagascariensis]|uniref:Uncharacterized protein n=1 Tax=Trichonephila inaurata madagascariensis TaxID=2747483 RepID=A0A8X6YBF0_9ARAC|nr:hypothetical protein TNIN_452091 [Trichonephila inaurata madagascariensis]GFY68041.1 hypothetical protein TNIN_30961 [Trichonephila inaurata madagascariensis]